MQPSERKLSQLRQLEAESIQIIREAAAEFDNPVMMYSVGKDSTAMLRLAEKAFAPGPLPFPLLHVDTTWKFQDMYRYRDKIEATVKAELIKHVNEEGVAMGMNPFDFGSKKYTDIMKTEGLKQALTKYEFDCAFGGARRDEEKSRAKERIFSFRDSHHQWDPKNQRPELWNVYNAKIKKGENVRVFPLSNWTELDVWQYIKLEEIPIVPLYFSQLRKTIELNGIIIPCEHKGTVDPEGKLGVGEDDIKVVACRFRSLGCIPCTGAVRSEATTIDEIIQEVIDARRSERENRIIDLTSDSSMEQKKREGYF